MKYGPLQIKLVIKLTTLLNACKVVDYYILLGLNGDGRHLMAYFALLFRWKLNYENKSLMEKTILY